IRVGEVHLARADEVEGRAGTQAGGVRVHQLAPREPARGGRQAVVAVVVVGVEGKGVERGAEQRLDAMAAAADGEAGAEQRLDTRMRGVEVRRGAGAAQVAREDL